MLIAKRIDPETGEIITEATTPQKVSVSNPLAHLTPIDFSDDSTPEYEEKEVSALTRLEDVLHVVETSFDLPANHDFTVVAFNARKYLITLSNRNFEFSVTIKNPEDFDL